MIICSPSARYRVIQKLGFGGYSTVWLVDILNKPGCAALRISKAGAVFEGEDDVLRRITTLPTTSHIAAILDDFTIDGPNGTHQVTVMEVLAPMMVAVYFLSQSAPSPSVPHTMRSHSTADVVDSPPPALHVFSASIYKTVVRSLVQAVAEVHAAGIVHGDLHLGNVGLALPTLADGSDTERIWSYPDVTIVFPRDPELAAFSSHFPPYIVQPWSFHSFLQAIGGAKIAPVVKIYDFGTSYCLERPHPTTGFLNQIVAPEWVIQGSGPDVMRTPDSACDIWALGVMIFCLMAGGVYPYTAYNSTAHFITMARLSGRIPRSWMVYEWANDPKLYEELSEEKCAQQWAEYRTLLRPRCESDADADGLVTLLRRMFSLDPSERPSAADILQDRWFLPPGTSEVNFTDTQYV
ncbi:kinase-like protein [Peniophora sp. CONT]|nr:kinase-like protein [Peniophora sp. CONT]